MKYEPALDGLRAVAVFSVVLFHAFPDTFPGGWMGVDIFFVLSGYLITTLLMTEIQSQGRISFSRFYTRRALRLMPEAACLFAFQFTRAVFTSYRSGIIQATLVSMLYFMNWSRAFDLFPQDVLGHMWSLSVEEQFYFAWPVVLAVIVIRWPITFTAALIITILIWRCFLAFKGASVDRTYNGFDTHGDALLVGCLLSFVSPKIRIWLGQFGWLAIGVFSLAFFVAAYNSLGMQTIGMTIVAFAAALLISAALLPTSFTKLLSLPPLIFTGRISYGWYLWHFPILRLGFNHGMKQVAPVIALIALSYCAAVASYFLIAKPALRLKRRFSAGETQSLALR